MFLRINKSTLGLQNSLCCIAALLVVVQAGVLLPISTAVAKDDRGALRPLLLLQDGQRYLARKGDPFPLLQLAQETKSTWVLFEANRSLADHYALTGSWGHYNKLREYSSPCAALLHAIYQQPENVATFAAAAQAESPKNRVCFAALNAATAAGLLRDDDIWRQIITLVNSKKTSQAKLLLRLLKEDKVSAGTLNKAVQNATRRIKGKHPLATRVSQQLLAVSAVVAAQRNPLLVGERWEKFAAHIDADINAQVWPLVGMWASLDHHAAKALSYFRYAPLKNHGRLALAWRARAAMRLGQWEEVKQTIAQMNGEQATFSAWRYWHAHARYRLGDKQSALQDWQNIANEFDDYYGLLAASHIGKQPRLGRAQPSAQVVALLKKDADVRLAVELGSLDRTINARRVWKFLQARVDDKNLLAMAEIAAQGKWMLGAINAADAAAPQLSSHVLRFPLPLRDQILPLTERFKLNPGFVYALIRRESRFNANARSSAGARGLMQIMPATAKALARQHKYTRYSLSRLTLPGTNLLLGTRYLADLNKTLDNDPVLVAAAYNAGPHRVRKWLKTSSGVERLVFIETIPFTETRLYVKAILGAQEHYGLLFGQQAQPLQEQLAGSYR